MDLPTADRIEIRGLRVFGRHGVFAFERDEGQVFVVDATLELDLSRAARSDALGDTVDYGALAGRLADAIGATRFDLVEALADHLAGLVLAEPGVHAVTVRVGKPEVRLPVAVGEVAVVLRRVREATPAEPGSVEPVA